MRSSIRTRLTFSFILLATVPLLLIGFSVGLISSLQQQRQVLDLQQETAQRMATEVDAFFSQIEGELQFIVHIQGLDTLDEAQFNGLLAQLPAINNQYEAIHLLDQNGRETYRIYRVGLDSAEPRTNWSETTLFRQSMETGQAYLSPLHFEANSSEPILTIGVPITDIRSGESVGVLVADTRVKPIWDLIGSIRLQPGEQVYIVDSQNQVIAHPNPSVVLRNRTFIPPHSNGIHTGLSGRRTVMAIHPLPIGNQTFTVVVEKELLQAFNLVVDTLVFTAVSLFIALAAAAFIGYKTAHRIVGPIESLVATAQAIEAGDLSPRADIPSQDEIGVLAAAFNRMTNRLSQTMAGLEENIAALEASESALQKSETLFRILFESAPTGITILDLNGRYLRLNRAFCDMLGYTREELTNRLFLDFGPETENQQVIACGRQLIAGEIQEYQLEKRYRHRDGHLVSTILSVTLVRNEQGEPRYFLSHSVDISERKRTEEALRQSQKLESIGVLAGGIAHDFNNLLTSVIAQSSLAIHRLNAPEKAQEHIEKGLKSAEKAADLTRQLLAYAGKGQFQVEALDLNQLILENAGLFETISLDRVDIEMDLAASLPLVQADRGQMQQLLMNLVMNGTEAIEAEHGRVWIKTSVARLPFSPDEPAAPAGLNLLPGRYVCLEVGDTGKGMDEETISQIFDPFFSTKALGRGLGLSATLGIIRHQHGDLSVQSRLGQGTTFRVFLPGLAGPQQRLAPEPASPEPVPIQATVLVIDDEAPVREAVRDILGIANIQVLMAGDGREGLDRFESFQDQIDLVLLDLQMPVMDGEETYLALKQMAPDVKIILSSGYSKTEMAARFAGAGLAGFLQKPYNLQGLLQIVQGALQNGTAPS